MCFCLGKFLVPFEYTKVLDILLFSDKNELNQLFIFIECTLSLQATIMSNYT